MDKKIRTIIIIGCIVTFIVVPLVTTLILSQVYQKSQSTTKTDEDTPPNRSNDEIVTAIITKKPNLAIDGTPIFAITNVDKPQKGWYIITIRNKDDVDGTNPAKILLYDAGDERGGLGMLLGPGTSFPTDVTQPLGIPQFIIEKLNT